MTARHGNVIEFLHGAGFGIIAAPLLSFLLFSSAFFIPAFGWVLSLFAPLPLVYHYFTFGRRVSRIAMVALAVLIGIIYGLKLGFVFMLTYSLMAMVLAESILRRDRMTMSVAAGAAIPMALTVLYLWISLPGPASEFYSLLIEQVKAMVVATIISYENAGVGSEQVAFLAENSGQIAKWVVMMMPGTFAVAYLSMSLANYLGYRNLQSRWPFLPAPDARSVASWSPPEKTVYMLIAGLIMALLPETALKPVGANLLILGFTAYSFSGICIIQHYFVKSHLPIFMRWAAYVLIAVQPFLLVMVASVGLFDLWFDFRKLKNKDGDLNDDGIDS
ncbi:MAG: DUF2232 domain-containing protein [Nitrospinota bacterium]